MSIFETTLHIPAEPRPFVPPRALTRVRLPLEAKPGLRFALAAFVAATMAGACLALALVLLRAQGDLGSRLGLSAVFAIAALVPAGLAATAVADASRPRPMLVVDADGLRDTRIDAGRIAWNEIAEAEIVGAVNGIAAVRLTLAEEGCARFAPLRIGGWSAQWAGRRRHRIIALALLDRRPHDLAHTILALAARAGATVVAPCRPPS